MPRDRRPPRTNSYCIFAVNGRVWILGGNVEGLGKEKETKLGFSRSRENGNNQWLTEREGNNGPMIIYPSPGL